MTITTPSILINKHAKATRFASLFPVMADKMGVIVVPMFWPKMIGIAVAYGIGAESASACNIPTDAEDD